MATARKLNSGNYRVRAFVGYDKTADGSIKPIYKSFTAPTKKEAEYMASEYVMFMKEKQLEEDAKAKEDIVTFDDGMDIYLNSKVNVLAPYTYTGYKCIQKTLKKNYPEFCNKDIKKITQNDVQIVINDLSTNVSQKTVRNRHAFISSVLKYNNANIVLNTTFAKKEHVEKVIPNDADMKKVLDIVKGTEYEVPVMLGAFGMLRVGEVCGLDYEKDINFKTGELTIRHNMVRKYDGSHVISSPKTYSGNRSVTVPMFVVNAIKKKGYVTNLYPETISAHFSELIRDNFEKHFTFHALRHYGASIRLYLGIPYEYVKREGGWSSVLVLQQIYAHAFPDKQSEFSNKSTQYFNLRFSKKKKSKVI